jgi:hypothetical protein
VPDDLRVAAAALRPPVSTEVGVRDRQEQHAEVDEERHGVEQEHRDERARPVGVRDQAAHERTDADPQVHHHTLHRECRVTPVRR